MQIVSIQPKGNGSPDAATSPCAARFPGSVNGRERAGSAPAQGCCKAPQPERKGKFEMRFFLLETKWWQPDLSVQHLHPPLNWMTYQTSHVFLRRELQRSMGRTETCSLLWKETGYFARCMGLGLVILLYVRPGRIFSWCQLSFCVPCGVLWSLLYQLT